MSRQPAYVPSPSRSAATMLLMAVALTYALTSLALLAGLTLRAWMFPLALIAAAAVCAPGCRRPGRALLLFAGAVLLSLGAGVATIDWSCDGIMYHQEAIARLVYGENPFRAESLTADNSLWYNHYAKAIETVAAAIASTTGSLEAGKAVNYILALSSLLLIWDVTLRLFPAWRPMRRVAVTLAVIANPVLVSQITTYYIDFSKYVYLLWTIVLVSEMSRKPRPLDVAALISVTVLSIATKFNIFFDQGLWLFGAIAWFLLRKNQRAALRVTLCGATGLLIGLTLAWHPYATNIITAGNPFFPLLGEGSVDIMTSQTPAQLGHGRIADFFISVCYPALPTNDQRIGGFGPLMPLILACVVYILVCSRRRIPGAVMFAMAGILASCFIFEQSWWARYIAQLWLIPALTLLSSFHIGAAPRATRLLLALMLLTIPLSFVQSARAIRATHLYRSALYEAIAGDTVTLLNPMPQFEHTLSENGVSFTVGDTVPGNPEGDIMFLYNSGAGADDKTFPMLILTPGQTQKLHPLMLHSNRDYNFYRYTRGSATPF